MARLGKKLIKAVTEKPVVSKPAEKHNLRGFLEIEQSGRKNMFCPGCGVKQIPPKDSVPSSCKNCGLNLLITGLELQIWWNP